MMHDRAAAGRRLSVEPLEDRLAPAAADLSAGEQYFLELVNRARTNPAAEAARLGIDLNEGLAAGTIPAGPVAPLASNGQLQASAGGHVGYLTTAGVLTHVGPDGSLPGDRMRAAGYAWTGYGENLAYSGGAGADEARAADALHRQLFVDANVAGRGHRVTLLDPRYREVGLDVAAAGRAAFVAQDFGTRGAGAILTGVAYTDGLRADQFYTAGEGIGGVTVVATAASGQTYRTTTTAAGGYALEVPAGTYRVAFTAPDGRTGTRSVTVASANVKVDFVPGAPAEPPAAAVLPAPAPTTPQAEPAPEPPAPPPARLAVAVAAGSPAGGAGAVRVLDPQTGRPAWDVAGAVPAGIGARVAAADFTGDGVADVVAGTGPGTATRVRVFDGGTHAEVFALAPFEAAFTGGVYVAAGDVSGDGRADLVITPDEGGGPRVRVFDGNGYRLLADFFGIDDPKFRGGARAAVGDLDRDGAGDLVVAAGFAGGPRVAGFAGRSVAAGRPAKLFADFFAFEQTLRNGTFVAVGDVDGDGYGELIAGGGPGGGPRVSVLSGRDLLADRRVELASYFGGDPASRDGARVAARDLDGDARADVIVGAGSRVTAFAGRSMTPTAAPAVTFDAETFPGLFGGVFVG